MLAAPSIGSMTWSTQTLVFMMIATLIILFKPGRQLLSGILTPVDGLVSFRWLTGIVRQHKRFFDALMSAIIFIPTSIPHLVGMFIYITTLGYFLHVINPINMQFPAIPMPLPVSLSQLFTYNGLGLVMVSFCGVGIFVRRNWREAFERLGWVKPTWANVGVAFLLVIMSFSYDLLWSFYTHGLGGQDLATKLSSYNSATFSVGSDFGTSILIAMFTAVCAGIGEETLVRGALQPAVGILPAALLHGVLHAQFSHAPILIIQVALWSCIFGIVRRFTNTTTTIMGHAGFNFVSTFLFAFNP